MNYTNLSIQKERAIIMKGLKDRKKTNLEIAAIFGVERESIQQWMRKPSYQELLKGSLNIDKGDGK